MGVVPGSAVAQHPRCGARDASRDPDDFLIRYATSGVMVVPRAFSGGGDARGDRYPGHRVVPVMPGVCPTPLYRARSTVHTWGREPRAATCPRQFPTSGRLSRARTLDVDRRARVGSAAESQRR